MLKPSRIAVAVALLAASPVAFSADSLFSKFTPATSSVPGGSLPESAPLKLSSPHFFQTTIASRSALLAGGALNSGNWDMIASNETGPNAGRFLFAPFETGTAGVMRVDRSTNTTLTIVNPGRESFVAGDASRWTPWGGYLTAEESWSAVSTKGRLFEVTNPTTTTGDATTSFVHRSIVPRVSHEGLAFDNSKNMYFIDELNGGSIYRYMSVRPVGVIEHAGRGADGALLRPVRS